MLIPKALNVAFFYLFLVWSVGLIGVIGSPYPGLYFGILFLLVIYWFLLNTITFLLCRLYKKKYDRVNWIGFFGLIVAVMMTLILTNNK